MPIAVIDIGKTNLKAVLFGEDGALLHEVTAPNKPLSGPPYLHIDEASIWRFVLHGLAQLNRVAPVRTISVTTHGASGALVNDDGLVLPIMDYEEGAVDGIEAEYAPLRPPFSESMSPPLGAGLNLGRQVFYQSRRHAEDFARARWLLTLPQYFAWKLTGVAVAEKTSIGCHTDLWAPALDQPSSMASTCGFDRLNPPMRRAFDAIGPLRPEIAAETGIAGDAQVLAGIHDSNASLALQLSGRAAPFTVISTGTWIVLLSVGGDLARLDPAADMMANIDASGRPVACAKFMGGREFAAIAGDGQHMPTLEAALAVMRKGLLALPAFVEQGGPYAGRTGRIVGGEPDSEAERAALASLYCALVTDDQLGRLGVAGPLIIDGNFGKNAVYAAALASFRPDQPVEASLESAGTAKGAAALAVWPRVFGERLTTRFAPQARGEFMAYRAAWREAVNS